LAVCGAEIIVSLVAIIALFKTRVRAAPVHAGFALGAAQRIIDTAGLHGAGFAIGAS
jgi:hypothetical protein